MADAEIVIAIRSDGTGARVIKRDLDAIADSGDKATASSTRLEKQSRNTASAMQYLQRTMAPLMAIFAAREVIRMADAMTMLQGRLQNATRSTSEAEEAFNGLRSIVQRTGTDMETAVSVFQRLSFVRDEISATTAEMLLFTDTVSKLGVISGAGTSAMSAGLTQLGQALSANIVRAEEWNSIMENIPAVGKQIADQFGVTTGQLRQLIIEGEVLSEDVFAAMINSASEVEEQFAKMPMTIGRAFNALMSDIQLFIGQTTEASHATKVMITFVDGMRLALHGLGVGFEAVSSIVGTWGALVTKNIENTVNMAINSINWLVSQANKVPGVEIELFQKANLTGGLDYADILKAGKDDLSKVLNQPTPQNTIFDRALGDEGTGSKVATREISKDYAELAKNISSSGDASKEATKAAKALEKQHKDLDSAIKGARTQEERLIDNIKELEGMRGIAASTGRTQELEVAISRANDELTEMRIQAERNGPVAKAFESLTNQIDDGFREAFKTAFTESDGGWKSLLEGWKATFKSFLADLAYMALARPIVLQMVGAVGGIMGVSSGAQASILGDIGGSGILGSLLGGGSGSGGLGSFGSLLSNGWSGLTGGLNSPIFGAGSMMGQGINWIGGQLGLNNASFIGPMMPGASNLASAFTPMAGIAGFGGNFLADMIFGGDRGIGATLGGAAGGIAGTAFGSSLAALGSFGGPIGALAGAFLGNALGGLFGGKSVPSEHVMAKVGLNFNNGTFETKKLTSDEADDEVVDAFAQLQSTTADMLNQILMATGLAVDWAPNMMFQTSGKRDGGQIRVGIDGIHPMGTDINDQRDQEAFGDDAQAAVEYAVRMVLSRADFSGIPEAVEGFIRKAFATSTDLDQALADVQLIQSVFGQASEALTIAEQTAKAIEEVNKHFDGMYQRAQALGLPMAKVTEVLNSQREAALDAVRAQESFLKAQKAGFQSMEAMKATFDGWLLNQSLSNASSLSPTQKLTAAQEDFGSLLSKAQSGDYTVTQQLLQSGQQLLSMGQNMYASSVDFAALEAFVRSSISQIAKDLEIPGYASGTHSARRGVAWVGEQGPELVDFQGGERVYNARESAMMSARSDIRANEQAEEISAMRQDIQNMNRQISRLVNKMMAVG